MFRRVENCRICGNSDLVKVLDLGEQMLTGVFPRQRFAAVTSGPIRLVKCNGDNSVCGLLQLEHSYDLDEMYGDNYGYRSGLNASMVTHLHEKVRRILQRVPLDPGDLVIDIGSNDSTTLQAYPAEGPILVGIDPTGTKFRNFYPEHIRLIPDFYSSKLVDELFPEKSARIVTSFSMFYDLESPLSFMQDVFRILADDGVWVFEQSYMPTMLATNSYDTVCHEHLEFYALRQIKWLTDRAGFKIVDVEFNTVNGGSFSVTVAKQSFAGAEFSGLDQILDEEQSLGLNSLEPFLCFEERAAASRKELRQFVRAARDAGKVVAALGASTKGNVLLQYCGFTSDDIAFVGEVNSEKFGCYTPGTWIPIISEQELLRMQPDYLIVLPWHFRPFFERSEALSEYQLVFPLPKLEIRTPTKQ